MRMETGRPWTRWRRFKLWLLCHALDWHRLDPEQPVMFHSGWFAGQCRRCRDVITYKSKVCTGLTWSSRP